MDDYFDYISRHKRQRRKASVIVAEKEERLRTIDGAFKAAIEEYEFIIGCEAINGSILLEEAAAKTALSYFDMRRSMKDAMKRIGWEKYINPDRKDGRWRSCLGAKFFIYIKKDGEKPSEDCLELMLF